MRALAFVLVLTVLGGGASGEAPGASPRPVARVALPEVAVKAAVGRSGALIVATERAVRRSLRPERRSAGLEGLAQKVMARRARGAVCGDLGIQGEPVAPVAGRIAACGIASPVRVRSVAGVALSTPALMDCTTAKALRQWVDRGLKPVVGSEGGGATSLRVVAHYACRPRNNQRGAKISEHGKGRAIDIAGIGLRDGSEITVLTGWQSRDDGTQLRALHKAACRIFGTVLGPAANRAHRDHFHFDTARYRSGSYCR